MSQARTKRTKWHFELHDGKGGTIIFPSPVTSEEVVQECNDRFGQEMVKEIRE